MGTRGPVGKRPDQRHGHGDGRRAHQRHDEVARIEPVTWPAPDPGWHPVAAQWFSSLPGSGQSTEYTQSDVTTAYVLADNLSRELAYEGQPLSAASLGAFLAGGRDLLTTVAARRRVALELAPPGPDANAEAHDAAVASLTARRRTHGPDTPG